jgi:sulfhydrogenase subunit beta (sulfur reductase)
MAWRSRAGKLKGVNGGDNVAMLTERADSVLVISLDGLDQLVCALRRRGYCVVGPSLSDGAVVYDELESAAELPIGWGDTQEAGTYRLVRRDDEARFGYSVGPHSWKQFLQPPHLRLWRGRRNGAEIDLEEEPRPEQPYAFFGVRGCDRHAVSIQDRVLMNGQFADEDYAARREGAFVVAVDCTDPAGTCFCVSMDTGPGVEEGFDLALTELLDGEHRFLVRVGSERGAEVMGDVPHRIADGDEQTARLGIVARSAARMGRELETHGLRELLQSSLEHPRWDEVAERCLTCGNCTMVCPTCFCTTAEDVTDLKGDEAERWRSWDTCFSLDHSYVHGGSVRPTGRSRYRQWLTHKLSTWWDQFDTSGCVGCGRCIAWCPVGIDITEEAAALRVPPSDGGTRA